MKRDSRDRAMRVRRAAPIVRLLVIAAVAGVYAPVLARMARIWWTDQYAAHGMFVPAFSALLVWLDRERLRGVQRRGNPAGAAVLLGALGLLLLGRGMDSVLLQGLSIVLAVAGAVLWSFGSEFLRAVAFPVGFLIFMVPLPQPVVDAFTLDLQRFAAGFAGAVLGVLGVPFYLNGVLIELPEVTLKVAELCNGLRFLTAFLVLATAFAQVSQKGWVRKLVLVLSAIPIAILANAVRVAAVAGAAYYVGPQAAHGFIHNTIGHVVWVLTILPLGGLGFVLRRTQRNRYSRIVGEGCGWQPEGRL